MEMKKAYLMADKYAKKIIRELIENPREYSSLESACFGGTLEKLDLLEIRKKHRTNIFSEEER